MDLTAIWAFSSFLAGPRACHDTCTVLIALINQVKDLENYYPILLQSFCKTKYDHTPSPAPGVG